VRLAASCGGHRRRSSFRISEGLKLAPSNTDFASGVDPFVFPRQDAQPPEHTITPMSFGLAGRNAVSVGSDTLRSIAASPGVPTGRPRSEA
jgi:hypothetical protein